MKITEIYTSIQGETQYAGLPCTLVRTTGCDLRCGYCDSAFAFHGGREMTLDDIVREVDGLGAPLVLLTGGEPMLQRELPALAQRLLASGYKVMIETSGAHPLAALPDEVVRIVDVKTPGSGESHRMRWELAGRAAAARRREVRARDEADYQWACDVIREPTSAVGPRCCSHPCMGGSTPKTSCPGCCGTGCRRGSTCSCTSTSGIPTPAAYSFRKTRHLLAERQDPRIRYFH